MNRMSKFFMGIVMVFTLISTINIHGMEEIELIDPIVNEQKEQPEKATVYQLNFALGSYCVNGRIEDLRCFPRDSALNLITVFPKYQKECETEVDESKE